MTINLKTQIKQTNTQKNILLDSKIKFPEYFYNPTKEIKFIIKFFSVQKKFWYNFMRKYYRTLKEHIILTFHTFQGIEKQEIISIHFKMLM